MKKYLKNREGMALPMVLVLMTIVMVLAAAMGMFAYSSYTSVRWMRAEKRAYYLAKAGVEAAAHAYQNAVSKTSGAYDDLGRYGEFTNIDKFVAVSEDSSARITTNRVYLTFSSSSDNDGTLFERLAFKAYTPEQAASDTNIIGYFDVEIGNGTDYVKIKNSDGTEGKQEVAVKVIKATAVCDDRTQVSFGYISPTETVSPNVLYNEEGYLSRDGISKEDAGKVGAANDKFIKTTGKIRYDEIDVGDESNPWARFFKGAIMWVFKMFNQTERTYDVFTKTSDANMVLQKPAKSQDLKTNDDVDNFYIFATAGDLFLDNVGLEVTPTKGEYASIGLYGDEIVVDGDITMEVFYTDTDGIFNGSIINTIANRYRLGTVVIGDATMVGPERTDPVPVSKGGLQYKGHSVPANKIYFNGTVYVKIYSMGGKTETYRVFNAGDMAYFYGGYSTSGTLDNKTVETRGVDLLKYFIDAVLCEKDGHVYGEALKKKMKSINDLYYGTNNTGNASKGYDNGSEYFADGTVLVRKINVKYSTNGLVKVDEIDGKQYGSVMDIMQPSPIDVSTITWGKPRGATDFD